MYIELIILLCFMFLIALYFIIKKAISNGIDQSKEVKLLRREIAELKKVKADRQGKHFINTKA
ncbi:hypothetical protein IM538_12640 [Cytobacillus suaedae]|nr:hypothetical protein IM538_12640 [Cytobacillus suaedae]